MDYMLEHKESPTMIKNQSNLNDYNNSKVLPYTLIQTELSFPAEKRTKIPRQCVLLWHWNWPKQFW